MTGMLKDDLMKLKSKLESIENQLEVQMKDVEVREDKWKSLDQQVQDLMNEQSEVIRFNVGGKKFATRKSTLIKEKDTLFYKMVVSNKLDFNKEIFLDRSPKVFAFILDFLRNGKINYQRFKREELDELKVEAEYYEIGPICTYLEDRLKEIEYVNFEFNGPYMYSGNPCSSNRVEDLKDKSLSKGICANSPGCITIELNNEWEIQEIEIAGYNGNSSAWYAGNGSGATIHTSLDKSKWTQVGTLPSNYGSTIQKVSLSKSHARFIKFQHNTYLGIGFLEIKKI
jgi:hypothetical protein